MVKILIMDEKTFHEQNMKDIEEGKIQKEDLVMCFDSLSTLRKVLTDKRVNLLRFVKNRKPRSLYELSKLVGKDLKNVQVDAHLLEQFGLITLEKTTEGGRTRVRPTTRIKKLDVSIPL